MPPPTNLWARRRLALGLYLLLLLGAAAVWVALVPQLRFSRSQSRRAWPR